MIAYCRLYTFLMINFQHLILDTAPSEYGVAQHFNWLRAHLLYIKVGRKHPVVDGRTT